MQYMRVIGLVLGCAVLALVIAPNTNYKASANQGSENRLLEPGSTYIHNFAFAERREACIALNYAEGTDTFSRCLEGFFPENPWFTS